MPLYDYKCEKCEKEEEVFAFISEPPPEHCGEPMKRQIAPTFIRKGGGLYSIDNPEPKPWGDLDK